MTIFVVGDTLCPFCERLINTLSDAGRNILVSGTQVRTLSECNYQANAIGRILRELARGASIVYWPPCADAGGWEWRLSEAMVGREWMMARSPTELEEHLRAD